VLEVKAVAAGYGGGLVVRGISVEVPQGQVRVLLGANGAGKSTLLRAISGLIPIASGDILLDGKSIKGKQPHEIAAMGIGHCLEGRRIFPYMNVKENLEVGGYLAYKDIPKTMDYVYSIFPVLKERSRQRADSLSGGERQMLAIGQALMARPKTLLLDEPSGGLSPKLTQQLGKAIRKTGLGGIGILWAEQNAKVALAESDFAYLLGSGLLEASGESKQMAGMDIVRKAYLGG
jgi:branched-chain amino acid transport system ATP-binding protein